jgi:NTP pyrophosphatase (non-canonical NTP hydrolase)
MQNKLEHAWNYFKYVHSITENTPSVVRDRREIVQYVHPDQYIAESRAHVIQQSRLLHGVMGLASEAGEIVACVLKDLFQYKRKPEESLRKEIGDLIWYLALVIDAAGFDLAEILIENGEKLSDRHFLYKATNEQVIEASHLRQQCNEVQKQDAN